MLGEASQSSTYISWYLTWCDFSVNLNNHPYMCVACHDQGCDFLCCNFWKVSIAEGENRYVSSYLFMSSRCHGNNFKSLYMKPLLYIWIYLIACFYNNLGFTWIFIKNRYVRQNWLKKEYAIVYLERFIGYLERKFNYNNNIFLIMRD